MKMEIQYGHRQFEIDLHFADRQDLSITVHPDLSIVAVAPYGSSLEKVEHRLKRRARWIGKQVRYFEQFLPQSPPKRYISGETHYYLGRQYRLKVIRSDSSSVRLLRGWFQVEVPDTDDKEHIRQLMDKWYAEHLRSLVEKRLSLYWPRFEKLGASKPTFRYRHMTRSWGSCSSQGTISLNLELSKVPLDCLDYVLVHELCHLLCPNHNDKFFRLISRLIPDWKTRKDRLERKIS